MRIGRNTIPPECHKCGLIDSPDCGQPVERYPDNDNNMQWPDWLCIECRLEQWHTQDDVDGQTLQQFLRQSDLEHKHWVEAKWDLYHQAFLERKYP